MLKFESSKSAVECNAATRDKICNQMAYRENRNSQIEGIFLFYSNEGVIRVAEKDARNLRTSIFAVIAQRDLLKLYATLRSSHKELLGMGQTMCLPTSEDLSIMNVAKLAPGQLLQLCAGAEINEIQMSNPPFDLHLLREIPNKIVASCEETLNSRKNIIDWFEEIMAKKMITKNVLVKKIEEFKTENEAFKRSLDKNKEDYLRFLNDSENVFKHGANSTLTNELYFQRLSLKLSDVNALNEELEKKLQETEVKATFAEKKSRELEKQLLRDAKHKKRDHMSKADLQFKSKEEEIAQLNLALEQANSKSRTLEKTVSQLRKENQEMRSNYDNKLKKLNESIDINTKLFDEITADRSKLLAEKQDLENQLIELSKNFEETLHTTKHESNSCIAKLMETEKKYKEVLDEKNILVDKIESMCAQLLESELRFKDASTKLTEMAANTRDLAKCRMEVEMLNHHLENTKEELLEYKTTVTNQTEAMQELRQNLNHALNSGEQLKNDLNNKEKYILELEGLQNVFEQRLLESKLKIQSYSEELSNIKTLLREVFGEFETIEELHEMIKQKTLQLVEANLKNNTLTEVLNEKDIELQKHVETITEQEHLLEEREAALKMLTDKIEEQTNIIKLLRNNLDDRTQADIEINRQLEEKNTEIDSLMSHVEKRKEQISQLEKIILTLENQIVKLSDQKRTAREAVSSLEKKLSEYESYYINNTKKTESPIDNLDDLINILEYELTNPSDDQFNCSEQEVEARRNKRGTHNDFKSHIQDNFAMYQLQKNVPSKGMSTYSKNKRNLTKDNHKGDGVCGNKMFPSVVSSEFAALQKVAANASKENKIPPVAHHTTNVNYCLMPNHIKDEKKLKMFKLAGHKLQ